MNINTHLTSFLAPHSPTPLFPLGPIYTTPAVLNSRIMLEQLAQALGRHAAGDWGELDDDDRAENNLALKHGLRLFSAYIYGDVKIWIITEADRSSTTILLPEDY